MNIDTGELRRMEKEYADEFIKSGFTPVPKKYSKEALRELGNKESVMVDMGKNTPLVNWAKKKKAKKRKGQKKTAKLSHRRNRR